MTHKKITSTATKAWTVNRLETIVREIFKTNNITRKNYRNIIVKKEQHMVVVPCVTQSDAENVCNMLKPLVPYVLIRGGQKTVNISTKRISEKQNRTSASKKNKKNNAKNLKKKSHSHKLVVRQPISNLSKVLFGLNNAVDYLKKLKNSFHQKLESGWNNIPGELQYVEKNEDGKITITNINKTQFFKFFKDTETED